MSAALGRSSLPDAQTVYRGFAPDAGLIKVIRSSLIKLHTGALPLDRHLPFGFVCIILPYRRPALFAAPFSSYISFAERLRSGHPALTRHALRGKMTLCHQIPAKELYNEN